MMSKKTLTDGFLKSLPKFILFYTQKLYFSFTKNLIFFKSVSFPIGDGGWNRFFLYPLLVTQDD